MKNKNLMDRIEINPNIMLGKPVIKGTRLPVSIIVEKIAYGTSIEEILKQYPFLKQMDINAALFYAAQVINFENVYPI
ncbi:protein of unknown function DUF433 [Caldithrix abyssi DSM 13497]|uniref:Uncharacterized conserved protein, DUF433 family n=1 Tax=Caldithrix abyssi DSM 13497 TaxID=880073 RepID=H1XS67_CALAY|nr:DUF433 domain-containing protein [Caldithrix abyssi]APF20169.1 Uncharacterized conserved protein, DUF433 family [Caldithrix abyssi DSM 13497]EHO40231.1 protein of unknown function DUF433 [Caldithrix abyssi DSM 13497]